MSRQYGKVHCAVWHSRSFKGLSERERYVFLYLLTASHITMVGAGHFPRIYMRADLDLPGDAVADALAELVAAGMVHHCDETDWLWLPRYIRFNPLPNPNALKAARKKAAEVPADCAWRDDFLLHWAAIEQECALRWPPPTVPKRLANGSDTVPQQVENGHLSPISEGFRNGIGTKEQYQEQDQYQYQKQEQGINSPPSAGRGVQGGNNFRDPTEAALKLLGANPRMNLARVLQAYPAADAERVRSALQGLQGGE